MSNRVGDLEFAENGAFGNKDGQGEMVPGGKNHSVR